MSQRRDYRNSYQAYIEGSAVRKAEPVYNPYPEKSREQLIKERNRRLAAKRNQRHAMVINPGYVAFLLGCTFACCVVAVAFIHLQSNITTHLGQITALEAQLSSIKEDNSAAENRIQTTMTLDEIKDRALNLGLVYPAADQVYYYEVENNDYMNQYGEILTK